MLASAPLAAQEDGRKHTCIGNGIQEKQAPVFS